MYQKIRKPKRTLGGGGGIVFLLFADFFGGFIKDEYYSTRVVQEGDRRCKKSTLNDLGYQTPLRIPLMNPVFYWIDTCTALEQQT